MVEEGGVWGRRMVMMSDSVGWWVVMSGGERVVMVGGCVWWRGVVCGGEGWL